MANDFTLRNGLGLVFLFVLPFAMYFRFRSATSEKLDRWQEGPFILFGLRLGSVPLFFGAVAWVMNPPWMAWSSIPLPLSIRWCGFALVTFAGLLLLWTFSNLGRNLTDTVVTRAEHTLVTTGPYRYVRHPFYLTFFLGVLGGTVAAANWFLMLMSLIPLGFIVARTRIEECKLVDRFGDDYRAYMRRVGRFFPRLRPQSP